MKKVLFAIVALLMLCPIGFASVVEVPSQSASSFLVCQFSLTDYSGTIDSMGRTGKFQVGLSCPQGIDVRATVGVYIDGKRVASKVVTIPAGEDYSDSISIEVGSDYNGMSYELDVQ
ncbi:MAG: hypothetical protein E7079_03280 [Bacteroidales bacterium]|nr:hypothetical protein [Bacteroidales bacterium]